MHSYTAYGFGIRSVIPLPVLTTSDDTPDVEVRLACLADASDYLRGNQLEFTVAPREARFLWDDIGAFVVRDGREILVDPAPGALEDDVRIGILGPALAALLQQRGFLLLHASAVVIDGGCVAFMGRSGWGKSTMAAALHSAGHPLLADDLLAVRFVEGRPRAFPGLLQFKLWPDAITALGGNPELLSKLHPEYEKRWLASGNRFHTEDSAAIERIYVLAAGESPAIVPLAPREAFLQLAQHSLAIRWFLKDANSSHFITRAQLAQTVPVGLLQRPRRLELLSELARLVERDVAHGR